MDFCWLPAPCFRMPSTPPCLCLCQSSDALQASVGNPSEAPSSPLRKKERHLEHCACLYFPEALLTQASFLERQPCIAGKGVHYPPQRKPTCCSGLGGRRNRDVGKLLEDSWHRDQVGRGLFPRRGSGAAAWNTWMDSVCDSSQAFQLWVSGQVPALL